MNRFCFLICALFALILTGCSDDDDALTISSDELKQTTWKVDKRVYSDPDAGEDDYKTSENLIIRFFDGNSGEVISFHGSDVVYGDQYPFSYEANGRILYIKPDNFLEGHWELIEKSSRRMVFQSYEPYKTILILRKEN